MTGKIVLISGWSKPGGSTLHHIALTNLLNENGYECTFYGPHSWHLDKCQSARLKNVTIKKNDVVISHLIKMPQANYRKHILSCHETNLFPLRKKNLSQYHLVQFVSAFQKDWHGVSCESVIIPPIVENISWRPPENNVAGVVGSIDSHKQTHLSIQQALLHGFDKVLLFGNATDETYFTQFVKPYVECGQAVVKGHVEDKVLMYAQVDAVYHHSKREAYGLVEAECRLAGIPFFGHKNDQPVLSREEIGLLWRRVLQ